MGCGANFVPLEMEIDPSSGQDAGSMFPRLLMEHLAAQRSIPFAMDFLQGLYVFRGAMQSDDGKHTIFLLEKASPGIFAFRYAYVYLAIGDNTYLMMHENTSIADRSQGYSSESDGSYKGLYRLSLVDARLCLGETKERPVIEGNEVKIEAADRMMRRSMYGEMKSHYTPTYCQGIPEDSLPGHPEGVRFYFDTEAEMKRFASSLTAAFPQIKTHAPE